VYRLVALGIATLSLPKFARDLTYENQDPSDQENYESDPNYYDQNMDAIFDQLQDVTEKFTDYCEDITHHAPKSPHSSSMRVREGTHS
jgi:hypothetical protein